MQMRFCNEHGMPHSQFLDWNPDDQAKALAMMFDDAQRCQLCGTADWEWEQDRHAYEPVLKTCLGCYYKEISREGQEIGPGVTVALEKPGTMASAQRRMVHERLARRDAARTRAEAKR